jgi:hypothetical protein
MVAIQPEREEKEKNFFFEKKKQKTFNYAAGGRPTFEPQHCPQQLKVFWFFFSKKNCFLPSTLSFSSS